MCVGGGSTFPTAPSPKIFKNSNGAIIQRIFGPELFWRDMPTLGIRLKSTPLSVFCFFCAGRDQHSRLEAIQNVGPKISAPRGFERPSSVPLARIVLRARATLRSGQVETSLDDLAHNILGSRGLTLEELGQDYILCFYFIMTIFSTGF